MESEKCKNSGNDLSQGKEVIHGPRKPRGALGHLPWGEAEREKREKRRWCAVERLSACDHLVTGESEGHEEPLGNDGTTRHSREVVEMSGKPGKP
ncbi:hypothetical protein CRG98_018269 [Punica granatum]|uniref:Uncharacterized protein n=1 Tax=Punica granatum TaxID=22663 RepID=A0A2I0JYB3_PUNGR|nr:hypothetical protein CRG98_018269 [Punica granatum]